eukprot:6473070-Amphidinium_carterae.1
MQQTQQFRTLEPIWTNPKTIRRVRSKSHTVYIGGLLGLFMSRQILASRVCRHRYKFEDSFNCARRTSCFLV